MSPPTRSCPLTWHRGTQAPALLPDTPLTHPPPSELSWAHIPGTQAPPTISLHPPQAFLVPTAPPPGSWHHLPGMCPGRGRKGPATHYIGAHRGQCRSSGDLQVRKSLWTPSPLLPSRPARPSRPPPEEPATLTHAHSHTLGSASSRGPGCQRQGPPSCLSPLTALFSTADMGPLRSWWTLWAGVALLWGKLDRHPHLLRPQCPAGVPPRGAADQLRAEQDPRGSAETW